jgi:hypothetical protein
MKVRLGSALKHRYFGRFIGFSYLAAEVFSILSTLALNNKPPHPVHPVDCEHLIQNISLNLLFALAIAHDDFSNYLHSSTSASLSPAWRNYIL